MTAQAIDTAQIAETAYQIWMDQGQPNGQDEAHWYAAIDLLTPAPKKKAPAKKKAAPKAAAAAKPAKKAPAKPRAKKAAAK